jgi:uncharacterized protein (DUF1810 family)
MNSSSDINRFIKAQESPYPIYEVALQEIIKGRKQSHWIWFIFPQLRGLGRSYNANFYGIANINEAEDYYSNPILRTRLRKITSALLNHHNKKATEILGSIDARKVCSCMTLFNIISPNDIFAEVLNTFYNGHQCQQTLNLVSERE